MTINSRKVLNIYRSLDREQIQFVVDKKIEGTHTLNEWLKKLHKIAIMDTLGDDSRVKSGNLSLIFGIFTAFTTILTISKPVLFFFPIGFFLLFSYFFVTYITLNKLDIGNHLRLFIMPLLEHLDDQNIVEGPVTLRMDFSKPTAKENLVQTIEDEKEKHRRLFRFHWMDGDMNFSDGVKITWEIKDEVYQEERSIQDKASNLDLTSKYRLTHYLKMKFFAPTESFESLEKEPRTSENGKYFIFDLAQQDTSDSMEEGMTPAKFIEILEKGYRKIKKKNEVNI